MKIKIIKAPSFNVVSGSNIMPPLAVSKIFSFLRDKGFDIVQEDINVINHSRAGRDKARLLSWLEDTSRFMKYLGGGEDRDLEAIAEAYLGSTDLGPFDVLLISVFGEDFCSSMFALLAARRFKKGSGRRIVIAGGEPAHRPYIGENFAAYNKAGVLDYYVAGPGEEPLGMLLQRMAGHRIAFEDIPGLYYRSGRGVQRNAAAVSAPHLIPRFEGLSLKRYMWDKGAFFRKIPGEKAPGGPVLVLPFQMTCGCPYPCAFCMFAQKKVSSMDPEEAVRGLEACVEKYKARHFFFLENTFNLSSAFVNGFCDEVLRKKLRIYWSVCASVRNISGPDILVKMRRAGACRLVFGLETASPSLLRSIDKKISLREVARVLTWSHEAGIWNAVEIIAGLPHEHLRDIYATAKFLSVHAPILDEVFLNRFHVRVDSPMHLYPEKFRIAHIRELKDRRDLIRRGEEHFKFAFDEIGGLPWRDKKRQIEFSYNFIQQVLKSHRLAPRMPRGEELNVLFYLYSRLRSKDRIKSCFARYEEEYLRTGDPR